MNIVAFTGAGISVESGIETFRDIKDGLWYNYNVDEVATLTGWIKNPKLVLEFHNMLREKCKDKYPNKGHLSLTELEDKHNLTIVTQNVDNLHEKTGASKILHIHGELFKMRDSRGRILDVGGDLNLGDLDSYGKQLRPHTVLFEEYPYNIDESLADIKLADVLIVIGTSLSISYVPNLISMVSEECKVYYIDPNPDDTINWCGLNNLEVIKKTASIGVPELVKKLMK